MSSVSRREFLAAVGSLSVAAAIPRIQAPARFLYAGSVAGGGYEGLTIFRLQSGAWIRNQLRNDVSQAQGLVLGYGQKTLYCHDGEQVATFHVDEGTGRLFFSNRQTIAGPNPVMCLHPGGRFLVVASLSSGIVSVLRADVDAPPGPVVDTVRLPGTPAPHRKPHPRACGFDASGRFFLMALPDPGTISAFKFDPAEGKLAAIGQSPAPGAARLSFHPARPYLYVVDELKSSIAAYAFDRQTGALEHLQDLAAIPPSYNGANTGSDIVVEGSGRFVYSANCGHDSIAIFSVDERTGTLRSVGWEPSRGKMPRNLAFDPQGENLYAANQDSHSVAVFAVDKTTGRLAPAGPAVKVHSPDNVVFR